MTQPSAVGPYTIERELGRGGMGVVYLGQDPKLDRLVAIKALPEHLAGDPERLARFEREARLLASITHPNIAGVYGLEDHGGSRFLVMEFVDGEPLSEVLTQQGRLPVREALRVGAEVCAGIEAAHEADVIHRDLKPGNIMMTPDGGAKVLDFGLAKESERGGSSLDLSQSPTASLSSARPGLTAQGQIIGTVAYMSPEQTRGKMLDPRTDIWSFGCVLFEMLSGSSPFSGETTTDSIGAILHREPEWSMLPTSVPNSIIVLLRRCLAKEPHQRLRHIGDARLEINEALGVTSDGIALEPTPGGAMGGARVALRLGFPVAALILIAAITIYVNLLFQQKNVGPGPALHLSVVHADEGSITPILYLSGPTLALAPDGSHLAYLGPSGTTSSLFVRNLSEAETLAVPGSIGARAPFFSPDSRQLGFVANGKIKIVALESMTSRDLCDVPTVRGASWTERDEILFCPSQAAGLNRVSVADGKIQRASKLDTEAGDVAHRFPEALPGGTHALFNVRRSTQTAGEPSIAVLDLDTSEYTVLIDRGCHARYVDGLVIFNHPDGSVMAVRFDATQRRIIGAPFPVLHGVLTRPLTGTSNYSVSAQGVLAFIRGEASWEHSRVEWRDRLGGSTPVFPEVERYTVTRLSPDGRYLMSTIANPSPDLWRFDLAHDPPTRLRLTSDGASLIPVWSPDSTEFIYTSAAAGTWQMHRRLADGSGEAHLLQDSAHYQIPCAWSHDGALLAYMELHPRTGNDLWILPLDGERDPWPVATESINEGHATFSPDGEWIAYASDESGVEEIYVRRSSGLGPRTPVSNGGGIHPVWRGKEIFFQRNDEMMVVAAETEPNLTMGTPRALFDGLSTSGPPSRMFDVSADGERFVATLPPEDHRDASFLEIEIVTNWIDQIQERVAGAGSR